MKVMTREHPEPDTKESGRKIRAGESRAKTKRIENRDQVMGWTTEPGDRNVVNNAENYEGKEDEHGLSRGGEGRSDNEATNTNNKKVEEEEDDGGRRR